MEEIFLTVLKQKEWNFGQRYAIETLYEEGFNIVRDCRPKGEFSNRFANKFLGSEPLLRREVRWVRQD